MKRRTDPARIVVTCPIFGQLQRFAKTYKVREHARGVVVTLPPPGARTEDVVAVIEGDQRYILVEENERVVYDSREHL